MRQNAETWFLGLVVAFFVLSTVGCWFMLANQIRYERACARVHNVYQCERGAWRPVGGRT